MSFWLVHIKVWRAVCFANRHAGSWTFIVGRDVIMCRVRLIRWTSLHLEVWLSRFLILSSSILNCCIYGLVLYLLFFQHLASLLSWWYWEFLGEGLSRCHRLIRFSDRWRWSLSFLWWLSGCCSSLSCFAFIAAGWFRNYNWTMGKCQRQRQICGSFGWLFRLVVLVARVQISFWVWWASALTALETCSNV